MTTEGEPHPESPPDIIDVSKIPDEKFHTYRKKELTKARLLTETDFSHRQGKIVTLEGESSFTPGDYLAVGSKGEEFPIRAETMKATKQLVGEVDEQGWGSYKATNTVKATSINKPFAVRRLGTDDVYHGKVGDYVVDTGKRQYIVDREIFELTYEPVREVS